MIDVVPKHLSRNCVPCHCEAWSNPFIGSVLSFWGTKNLCFHLRGDSSCVRVTNGAKTLRTSEWQTEQRLFLRQSDKRSLCHSEVRRISVSICVKTLPLSEWQMLPMSFWGTKNLCFHCHGVFSFVRVTNTPFVIFVPLSLRRKTQSPLPLAWRLFVPQSDKTVSDKRGINKL